MDYGVKNRKRQMSAGKWKLTIQFKREKESGDDG
jgi:hypothetical protein